MSPRDTSCFTVAVALLFAALLSAAQSAPNPNGKTAAERLGYPASSSLLVIHADDFG